MTNNRHGAMQPHTATTYAQDQSSHKNDLIYYKLANNQLEWNTQDCNHAS